MHLAGHYYHVYNRGCNRQRIFANDGNYIFLLKRAKQFLADYSLSVIAYCLMPNHYHFLLRPEDDDSLSRFIQRLFNSYTQAFNNQQGRSGTLFEGRAKIKLVSTDEYVILLCRYIHLNPVQAGLVSHPNQWAYSNYLEWVEQRNGVLVDREFVQKYFSTAADLRPISSAAIVAGSRNVRAATPRSRIIQTPVNSPATTAAMASNPKRNALRVGDLASKSLGQGQNASSRRLSVPSLTLVRYTGIGTPPALEVLTM